MTRHGKLEAKGLGKSRKNVADYGKNNYIVESARLADAV